jgi:ABC-2 type transport system ATP-binding protein
MSIADLVISVNGLSKSFAGHMVLNDLSFHAMSGEILGLVGANGGGKTTTLRVLAGLLRPDAGNGSLLGRPLFNPSNRRHLGYMTQRNALYPDLTVAENLAFRAAVHGIDRGRIANAAEAYGIGNVLGRRVSALSGGWARRVEFAATVLHKPKMLLLDEPTTGLDVVARCDIWRWMNNLACEGCAIIVSTHDLIDAEQCSKILLFNQGKVHGPVAPPAKLEDVVIAMAAP